MRRVVIGGDTSDRGRADTTARHITAGVAVRPEEHDAVVLPARARHDADPVTIGELQLVW
jgi:hypothetical protein